MTTPLIPKSSDTDWQLPTQSPWPMAVSLLALALSVSALAMVWNQSQKHPLEFFGESVEDYDFSTPWESLRSHKIMELNPRATWELHHQEASEANEEFLRTVKLHRESEYKGTKILFITLQKNGLPRYEVVFFEKDADTGRWMKTYLNTFNIDEKDLQKAISDWEDRTSAGAKSEWESVRDALT